ncbi:site-specific integrase [Faecalibacterium sp. Marseille-P9590]|uniref:site-specific integrase n=1 Tax=Faecalibacterium sp. Marseille-P9590 TaxID=2817017 RepID=UPI00325BF4DD
MYFTETLLFSASCSCVIFIAFRTAFICFPKAIASAFGIIITSIEEDGSVIHIRQAVKVVKGTVSIGSPKSKDSIRDIPVPLNVRPCAIKLRDTTDQFIWESPKTGLPCNPTHFRDVFRKSLEEAGDVRLLTPHSCRHTYVSQMQALGVDIQTIQSIVGHADTEMTEHYLHVQESIRQSAIQLFSEAFSA